MVYYFDVYILYISLGKPLHICFSQESLLATGTTSELLAEVY